MPLYPVSPIEPFSKLMKLLAAGKLGESLPAFAYLLWVTIGYCLGAMLPVEPELATMAGPKGSSGSDLTIDVDPVDSEAAQTMGSILAKLDSPTPVAIENVGGEIVAGAAPAVALPIPPLLLKSLILWAAERLADIIVRKFGAEVKA